MNQENQYFVDLYQTADRLLLWVLTALLFVSFALAPWHHTWAAAFTVGIPAWAVCAWLVTTRGGALVTRCAIAASMMIFASLQIDQARGMIEVHFSIFVLLAFLLFYRDWVPLVFAAGVIAVLHLSSDMMQRAGHPVWVFSTAGGIGIVLVHAVFVVLETALLVWMSIQMRREIAALGGDPRELSQAAQALAKGDLGVDFKIAGAGEESLVYAMDRMRAELKTNIERERAAAAELQINAERERISGEANSRLRAAALDRIGAGAMVTDLGGEIIYVNDFANDIFRTQAAELRKLMPQFDPGRLVGQPLDMFERIPALTRNVLGDAASSRTTDVEVGSARLRVTASPVIDTNGRALGVVIQWMDRTPEVTAEEEIQSTVERANRGDLTVRLREEDKSGFFGALARGMNSLIMNMADVIRALSMAASEVRSGADEISRGNLDLSQRTKEQASSLEQTAASMEQMTSIVKNNADNAAQADQLAVAAREQAEKSGQVVGSAVTAMGEINSSSKKIADIIGVIDEIAFQTNLLALNAAVEAARAGEQGRGFAVVAAEVRNLASRSAGAAKEIKTLIQDSVGKVSEGTRLVDETGKVLGAIVLGVKRVTDVVAEIAVSSREQATGIDQVNRAVTAMDTMTQQNAALVEESTAAAQALTVQALNLAELIGRYTVGGADGSTAQAPLRLARARGRSAA